MLLRFVYIHVRKKQASDAKTFVVEPKTILHSGKICAEVTEIYYTKIIFNMVFILLHFFMNIAVISCIQRSVLRPAFNILSYYCADFCGHSAENSEVFLTASPNTTPVPWLNPRDVVHHFNNASSVTFLILLHLWRAKHYMQLYNIM